ncbi:hypothetical protein AB1N83_010938 [Pleurotus pulmonarius]
MDIPGGAPRAGTCPPKSLFWLFWYRYSCSPSRWKSLYDRHTLEGRLRRRPIVTMIFYIGGNVKFSVLSRETSDLYDSLPLLRPLAARPPIYNLSRSPRHPVSADGVSYVENNDTVADQRAITIGAWGVYGASLSRTSNHSTADSQRHQEAWPPRKLGATVSGGSQTAFPHPRDCAARYADPLVRCHGIGHRRARVRGAGKLLATTWRISTRRISRMGWGDGRRHGNLEDTRVTNWM